VSTEKPRDPSHSRFDADITAVTRQAVDDAVAAGADTMLSLVMVEGHGVGRRVRLGERPVTAGRDRHLDIVLADSEVSRLHCLASVLDGAVVVEDLGSTNGTFVNGHRISTRAPLSIGSLLRVGEHVFRCERISRRDFERADEQHRDIQRAAWSSAFTTTSSSCTSRTTACRSIRVSRCRRALHHRRGPTMAGAGWRSFARLPIGSTTSAPLPSTIT